MQIHCHIGTTAELLLTTAIFQTPRIGFETFFEINSVQMGQFFA